MQGSKDILSLSGNMYHPLLPQHAALLPIVLLRRVISGAQLGIRGLRKGWKAALTPVSGSSGERYDGNIANLEMWDEYGCSLGVAVFIIFSLLAITVNESNEDKMC